VTQDEVVGETGFEPATLCSQSRCATRLRYSPIGRQLGRIDLLANPLNRSSNDGGPGRIRTYNLAVMSGRLYR
jgi:hypothetical protein